MIYISPEIVALATIIAVFFCITAIAALRYAYDPRNKKAGKTWLFDRWQDNIFDTLFRNKDENVVAKKIGVNVEKYLHQCKLNRKEPRVKLVVVDKIVGFVIFGVGCVFFMLTFSPLLLAAGVVAAFPFIALPLYVVDSATKKRQFQMADELPRFLDMLHTALLINIPVEQAIELTAKNLKGTILSEEFLLTLADTKVGAYSWQKALEKLASDYEVDVFSDFVLDLTNAYNNGTSIVDSVARKSKDIKHANLVTMKERASRMTSTILFPILIFKIVPILLLMCIPIIQQLNFSGLRMM